MDGRRVKRTSLSLAISTTRRGPDLRQTSSETRRVIFRMEPRYRRGLCRRPRRRRPCRRCRPARRARGKLFNILVPPGLPLRVGVIFAVATMPLVLVPVAESRTRPAGRLSIRSRMPTTQSTLTFGNPPRTLQRLTPPKTLPESTFRGSTWDPHIQAHIASAIFHGFSWGTLARFDLTLWGPL